MKFDVKNIDGQSLSWGGSVDIERIPLSILAELVSPLDLGSDSLKVSVVGRLSVRDDGETILSVTNNGPVILEYFDERRCKWCTVIVQPGQFDEASVNVQLRAKFDAAAYWEVLETDLSYEAWRDDRDSSGDE